jgi:arylsulfatase A-like enzyme
MRYPPSLRILVTLLASLAGGSSPLLAADRPKLNFIVILIDDMGWRDIGCNGSKFYQTPNIDKLAAQGMRLTQAYAACPVCSPTRASILTGKYPARLHLTDWLPGRADRPSQKLLRPKIRQHLPLKEVTLARALKSAGYVSASIGKWHLGGPPYYPEKHGFDVNIGGTFTGSPPGGYFKFKTPTLKARNESEYLTDRLTEEAEKFITRNKDRPFFLYLAHYAVHIPLQAKRKTIAKYLNLARPENPQHNALYAAAVESVDDSVGRVLKRLEELKIDSRTIILFTSDNGGLSVNEGPNTPATSNAPLRAGKGYLYEGGIREPLLVRWPGVTKPGGVCTVPVSSVDFYPTFLELARVKPRPNQVLDGVCLVPLLKGRDRLKRDTLFWHYPHYSNQGGKPGGAIRKGDFKFIEFYEDGKQELYDLKNDISEKNNLAAKRPDKVRELQGLLKSWRKSVAAQMPTPNPDYQPSRQR